MNKDEKRELRRRRLMDNKTYQTMRSLTRYMDRYYLDALIGIIPGFLNCLYVWPRLKLQFQLYPGVLPRFGKTLLIGYAQDFLAALQPRKTDPHG